MAINGVNGSGFNPYASGIGVARNNDINSRPQQQPLQQRATVDAPATSGKSIADAIKTDASSRLAQLTSPNAPDGVDQELWSVLSKDERSYFMKAGTMGPLTYGRFSAPGTPTQAPMVRGGRLDIKA